MKRTWRTDFLAYAGFPFLPFFLPPPPSPSFLPERRPFFGYEGSTRQRTLEGGGREGVGRIKKSLPLFFS